MKKKERMAKVYATACQIYTTWQEQGKDGLEYFFQQELKIPVSQAIELARRYKPIKPPTEDDGCKNQILQSLNLQLPTTISEEGTLPKNTLVYWILKKVDKNIFDFKVVGKQINFSSYPCNAQGQMISLKSFILEEVEVEKIPTHMFKKSLKIVEKLGKKIGQDLTKVLFDSQIIFPPANEIDLLCDTIEKGLRGATIVLVGEFYPDYAYRETGLTDIPYEYTFDQLRGGVGLVAQQIAGMLPFLTKFFRRYNIKYEIKLAVGDFEADNPQMLKRVKISKSKFIEKCECSLAKLGEILPDIPINLFLFQEEWAKQRWKKYVVKAQAQLSQGNFSELKNKTGKNPLGAVEFISRTSKKFYNNLCAKELTQREIQKIVLCQGAEHATVARVFAEDIHQPMIQLAGDYPKLQMFNRMYAEHTTLCAQRVF